MQQYPTSWSGIVSHSGVRPIAPRPVAPPPTTLNTTTQSPLPIQRNVVLSTVQVPSPPMSLTHRVALMLGKVQNHVEPQPQMLLADYFLSRMPNMTQTDCSDGELFHALEAQVQGVRYDVLHAREFAPGLPSNLQDMIAALALTWSFDHTLMGLNQFFPVSAPLPKAVPTTPALLEWLEHPDRTEHILNLLKTPTALIHAGTTAASSVTLSDCVDFGIVSIPPPKELKQRHKSINGPRFSRSMVLHNRSSTTVLLVDVLCAPASPYSVRVFDDFGSWTKDNNNNNNSSSQYCDYYDYTDLDTENSDDDDTINDDANTEDGILGNVIGGGNGLAEGEDLSRVSAVNHVSLSLSQLDIKQQQQQQQLNRHSAVLLAPNCKHSITVELNNSVAKGVVSKWLLVTCVPYTIGRPLLKSPIVLGRRVQALVPNSRLERTVLSRDAPPFHPAHYHQMFDTPPYDFTCGTFSPLAYHPSSPAMPAAYQRNTSPPTCVSSLSRFSPSDPALAGRTILRRLVCALLAEEAEMEILIRQYDMFDTFLVPIQEHPHALFELHVPGLADNHPSLVPGDKIFIRPAAATDNSEHCGFVHSTNRAKSIVIASFSQHVYTLIQSSAISNSSNNNGHLGDDATNNHQRIKVSAQYPHHGQQQQHHGRGNITTTAHHKSSNNRNIKNFMSVRFHVRLSFDRTPLLNMHRALEMAKVSWLSASLDNPYVVNGELVLPKSQQEHSATLPALVRLPQQQQQQHVLQQQHQQQMQLKNPALNTEQQRFVRTIWLATKYQHDVPMVAQVPQGASDPNPPFVLFGPPGTGKTITLVECVLQALSFDHSRVLVCAPSNFAADSLCVHLSRHVSKAQMCCLNDPRRDVPTARPEVLTYCFIDKDGTFSLPEPAALFTKRVVVCSCNASSLLYNPAVDWYQQIQQAANNNTATSNNNGDEEPSVAQTKAFAVFSHVFVDEASQAMEPECYLPLGLCHMQRGVVVLAGDPYQLGPQTHSVMGAEVLAVSLQDRLVSCLRALGKPTPFCVALVRNYRSHPRLLSICSQLFYSSRLAACAPLSVVQSLTSWRGLPNKNDCPLLFYGVKGRQMKDEGTSSYYNTAEADAIVGFVSQLLADDQLDVRSTDIGVLAPFRQQVQVLRRMFRGIRLQTRVGTVDDYQGQEERIVLISTTLTDPRAMKRNHAGLMQNAKRFNVAVSRAQALLIVVGHPEVVLEDEYWGMLLRHCVNLGAYAGAPFSLCPNTDMSHSATNNSNPGSGDGDVNSGADGGISVLDRTAELSLLGSALAAELDDPQGYSAVARSFMTEAEWRVAL